MGKGIADILGLVLGFTAKNPLVSKMVIFTLFTALIAVGVSYMQDLVAPYIVNNSLLSFGAYLGVIDALSLYLTIVLAGFGVKQLLAFIRS